jgi:hypothetical protein
MCYINFGIKRQNNVVLMTLLNILYKEYADADAINDHIRIS